MSSNTRTTPEKVGRIAAKVASEAAYVITGMADVVAGTVRDVVNQSRAGYSERKASGGSPVKDYAKQLAALRAAKNSRSAAKRAAKVEPEAAPDAPAEAFSADV